MKVMKVVFEVSVWGMQNQELSEWTMKFNIKTKQFKAAYLILDKINPLS